jgi:predicted nucleic acid-binding protein
MVLIDTSVLIDYLKGVSNQFSDKVDNIINNNINFGINYFIYQEILQGARNESEFLKLKSTLSELRFYYLQNEKYSYESAAQIYFDCRRNGITIRSTIDLLIVQTAIENRLLLLHNDNDFTNISKVINNLEFY